MLGKDQIVICMRIYYVLGDGFVLIGLFFRFMDKKFELFCVKKLVVIFCDK